MKPNKNQSEGQMGRYGFNSEEYKGYNLIENIVNVRGRMGINGEVRNLWQKNAK
jgi:hypothetical protein